MITLRRTPLLLAALAAAGALLAGCNSHTDKISDILNDPAHYAHHDVTIAGEVTDVKELPLGISNLAAYRVNDGSGQVWVVSHAGAPVVGDKVGVKGEVAQDDSLNVLGTSLLTIIREHDRRVR